MSRGSGDHYRKHAKAPVTKHRPGIFGRILTEASRELPFGSTRVLHPWAAWPGALRPKFGPSANIEHRPLTRSYLASAARVHGGVGPVPWAAQRLGSGVF